MDTQTGDVGRIPTAQRAEWALTIAKMGASFVPVVGGAAAELLEALTRLQLDKRRTEWFEAIARGLYELQQQVADVTPEKVAPSVAFTSAFLQASQAALRTTHREKLQALRNVVLHAALPDAPEENMLRTFIDNVDALTTWHLDLLQCVAYPLAWAAERRYPVHDPNINPVQMFEAVHRERLSVRGYERILVNDLYNRGLATTGVDPYGPLYPRDEDSTRPRLTDLGRQFLHYIASPRPDDPDDAAAANPQEAPYGQA